MPAMEGTTKLTAPADGAAAPIRLSRFPSALGHRAGRFMVRWLEMLAVSIFVWQATGSAFLVAMMGMLRILPMGLFGAPIGVLAERVQPRSALTAIVLVSLLTSAGLARWPWPACSRSGTWRSPASSTASPGRRTTRCGGC